MKGRFAKKNEGENEVGDYVSVRIPREDRTSTDVHVWLCKLLERASLSIDCAAGREQ